jgi:hypothetical protein
MSGRCNISSGIDESPGATPSKKKLVRQEGDSRARRRLLAIEKPKPNEKRQVIDAFIERGHLERKAEGRAHATNGPKESRR